MLGKRLSPADEASRDPARDPQDSERLLVSPQRTGDVDGIAALYELYAVFDCGGAGLSHRSVLHCLAGRSDRP